jgi:hypothetical protein
MSVAAEARARAKGPLDGLAYHEPCATCGETRGGTADYQRERLQLTIPETCRHRQDCLVLIREELGVPVRETAT